MSGYRQFMTLVRKEAKAHKGGFFALLILIMLPNLYILARELFSSSTQSIQLSSVYFHSFGDLSRRWMHGIGYAVMSLYPILITLYIFIIERTAKTSAQLRSLPVPASSWALAKVMVIAGGLSALLLFGIILNQFMLFIFSDVLPTNFGGFSYQHVQALFSFILSFYVFPVAATFTAFSVARAIKRYQIAVGTIGFILIFSGYILLHTLISPHISAFFVMNYEIDPLGSYLVVYPLAWIALTLGAGLFIHEKYGEA